MNIRVYQSAEQIAGAAASIYAAQLTRKPDSVFGFATGSTPIPTYQALIKLNQRGELDFSRCVTYNLDEYVGLATDHDQSYDYFMRKQLFDHINIKRENTHLPSGIASDLQAECARYDAAVDTAGGVDVMLLGVGLNGHIGFNEPSDAFVYGTNIVNLTESTIAANVRFFSSRDEVPRQALSMGIGQIMASRQIVFIAMGEAKATILKQAFQGPVMPQVPASILQFHPNAVILLDEGAASLL